MPRRNQIPSYRCRKHRNRTDLAVVTINDEDIYLGKYGTPESKAKYDRLIAEWLAAGRVSVRPESAESITVATLVNAFRKSGDATPSHKHDYMSVWKLLARLYGRTPVAAFGPLALLAVREQMIATGWNRKTINQRTYMVRRIFRWGVVREMVPATVSHALEAVEGLREGRSVARESVEIAPVALTRVEACLPHMPPMIQSMVMLQLHSGMRAGELVIMRTIDIDTTGPTWIYKPSTHKTAYRGKVREVAIGPKARAILEPMLRPDLEAFIFSPAESERQRREAAHRLRKTAPQQGNRPGTNRVSRPARVAGTCYDVPAYRYAIYRAADAAFPPPPHLARARGEKEKDWRKRLGDQWCEVVKWRNMHRWHPHQLRHTFATQVRDMFSLDHAQRALGHAHAKITETYAQVSIKKAIEVAAAIG